MSKKRWYNLVLIEFICSCSGKKSSATIKKARTFLFVVKFSIIFHFHTFRSQNFTLFFADGGEGHVGTLCEVGRSGSTHSPEKTVVVNWDSGHRTNYRVGYQGQHDLIVVDNAQIGVRHPNVICDGCKKAGIAGILFRCADCPNFDLCSHCYGNDVHSLDHPFIRFQTSSSVGWVVWCWIFFIKIIKKIKNSIKISTFFDTPLLLCRLSFVVSR